MDSGLPARPPDRAVARLQELLVWLSRPLAGGEPATPQELAEMLWLAERIAVPPALKRAQREQDRDSELNDSDAFPRPEEKETGPSAHTRKEKVTDEFDSPIPPLPPQDCAFFPSPPTGPKPAAREAHLLPRRMLPGESDLQACLPLRLSIPPLLGEQRLWHRALKPLEQRMPLPGTPQLDEAATVERSAEAGCLQPVFRPRQQPRFALQLVVDQGQAMELWQPLVEEWQQLLSRSRIFRDVRRLDLHPPRHAEGTYGLERLGRRRDRTANQGLPASDPVLSAKERSRRLSAALASDPDSLVLLISDTAGPHWWDGSVLHDLRALCSRLPLAIVHTLPRWLARRTVLQALDRATIRNGEPASPNHRYWAHDPDGWYEPQRPGTTLPVVSLKPGPLAGWSSLVMARRDNYSIGVFLSLEPQALQERLKAYRELAQEADASSLSALQRWEQFRDSASTEAHQLMRLLAAAPVLTLPVMRLIREAVQGPSDSGPLPLVEGLLSGLLQPLESAQKAGGRDLVRYEVVPDVAELLRDDLSAQRTVDVVRAVSNLLEQRWDSLDTGYSFVAGLIDPQVITELRNRHRQEDMELADGLVNFATATADRLARIPGPEYQKLVAQLRSSQAPPPTWPASMAFEVQEFETAQLVAVPEIEAIAFTTAWQEEIPLHRVSFLTLAPEKLPEFLRRVEAEGGAAARQALSRGEAWAFEEPLGRHGMRVDAAEPLKASTASDPLSLTLLEIPAGSFQMGSPETEKEGNDDERPQHPVELESFFISQTPITQAQWREVAGWQEREGESWGRELKPSPSRFQGREGDGQGEVRLFDGERNTDQRPVELVSWWDAMEFCSRLSQRTGKTYTLPSEAQWEYACRAGTKSPFHFGEIITPELANYDGNYAYAGGVKGEYRQQTTPVGMLLANPALRFPANAWGLQDMHGNVWEWCLDRWNPNYEGAPADGSAWIEGKERNQNVDEESQKDVEERRLLRGGSWFYPPGNCRSAYRDLNQPGGAYGLVGFRVVCLPQGPSLNP